MDRVEVDPGRAELSGVLAAERRLAGRVRRTALEGSSWLSRVAGREVLLKLESQQRTGSFKIRGAMNAIASLNEAEQARGVVTASAGNHGLGVALAAAEHGVRATIYVPAGAPAIKRRRIEELGAGLVTVAGDYDMADAEAQRAASATGSVYIHAFSDPAVVAGQGTVALEIAADRPDVSVLLVPVGGGGLIGGMGLVARGMLPGARVVGVQSEHASAMAASLRSNALRPGMTGPTLCDGLAGNVDARSFTLAREVVDEMVVVAEDSVAEAVRQLYAHEGLGVEGSAAVVVAALLEGRISAGPGPAAAVLTGANIDGTLLSEILSS
jgi:threonine dehydratase